MKTQVRKYISFLLPALIILFSIGLLNLLFFLIVNDYDSVIQLLLKYSHFPEAKLKDMKSEYLNKGRFQLLRYVTLALFLLSVILSGFALKWKETISHSVESFCIQVFNAIMSLGKAFKDSLLFDRAILAASFLYVTGLVLWGTFTYPLIYDEVFSYLYFVNKGFLVTASYYPGPNNHILYLLSCNVIDCITDNPLLIMRISSLMASLATAALLLLYFNKRFSASFAAVLTLCLFSSYSVFYYSFHGRGYSFILLFFTIVLVSIYEYVKKRKDFYLTIVVIASIAGTYTIPVFIYPLGAFAVFMGLMVLIKKDKRAARKFLLAYFVIGVSTLALYSPVILVSGLDSIVNNSWVQSLSWNDFILGYGIYIKELQNHFWDVSDFGWIISTLVFCGGLAALFKWRKTWWILLSFLLLVCPFIFLFIQKVFPFMRTLDYLYVILVFLLTSFLIFLLSFFKGKTNRIVCIGLLSGIACLNLIKVLRETPFANKYYKDLELVMTEIVETGITKVYSKDDTYSLFLKYYSTVKDKNLELLTQPELTKEEIFIIPAHETINPLKGAELQLLVENQSVKVYKIYKK